MWVILRVIKQGPCNNWIATRGGEEETRKVDERKGELLSEASSYLIF